MVDNSSSNVTFTFIMTKYKPKFDEEMKKLLSALLMSGGAIEGKNYSDACMSLIAACGMYDENERFRNHVNDSINEVLQQMDYDDELEKAK